MAVTPNSSGRSLLILLESKTTPGTYVPVAGQRSVSISEENETIETTHKLSGRAKTYEVGLYDCTISGDGVYVFGETEYDDLKDAVRNGDTVKVRLSVTGATVVDQADAIITSFETEAEYDSEATYSIELQVSGGFTEVTLS